MGNTSFHMHFILVCLTVVGVTSASEIRVTVRPSKTMYILGEPVVCDFAIKNVSRQDIAIGLSYPRLMGLEFPDYEPPEGEFGPPTGGTFPVVRLAANQEYRAKIALNRYVAILRAGQHRLRYAATLFIESVNEAKEGAARRASEEGVVEFGVVDGTLGADVLKSFADALDQEDSQKVREGIEMLMWIDDPRAIDLLKKASRITFAKSAAPKLVYARWTVLYGLAKFLHLEEARSVFFGIAAEGNSQDMAVAYRICMDKCLPVPEAIVKGGLGSNDGSRRYSSLEYLLSCGTPAQAEWVVPLTKDESRNIRALAEKVLAKFKADAEKKKGK